MVSPDASDPLSAFSLLVSWIEYGSAGRFFRLIEDSIFVSTFPFLVSARPKLIVVKGIN